ncbi:hypothetical protein [Bacillus sp. 2205SS5-2]|uniref:hypothetical protein n=1 Tax=Bacillus sp. 2205SS5-2 TaxID=3109031 RepID=UPI003007542B
MKKGNFFEALMVAMIAAAVALLIMITIEDRIVRTLILFLSILFISLFFRKIFNRDK